MATYTPAQMIQKLRNGIPKLEAGFARAVVSVHAEMTERIFVDGEDASGAKYGQYNDTKELYINPADAPRKVTLKGKYGDTKFKNGKPHKTGHFPSYKAFRAQQGRETNFVNLRLSGQLQSDFRAPPVRTAPGVYVVGTSNQANTRKLNGAIHRYGNNIFVLSPDEHKELVRLVILERLKIGI